MKYLVTAAAADEQAKMDERFGRAPWFMIYDDETGKWTAHANTAGNAAQGAGIQAAQTAVNLGAAVVISGAVGPKALQVLESAGVKVFSVRDVTVTEALDCYNRMK